MNRQINRDNALLGPSAYAENLEARVRCYEIAVASFLSWAHSNSKIGPPDSNLAFIRVEAHIRNTFPEARL